MVFYCRSAYKNRHARNSSWPGKLISNQRPDTLTQTASPRPQLFSCSHAADHTSCLLMCSSSSGRKTSFTSMCQLPSSPHREHLNPHRAVSRNGLPYRCLSLEDRSSSDKT